MDPRIDFNWGDGAPAAGIRTDQFSVRWTGELQVPTSGPYTFSTNTDDGIRLWLEDELIIKNWTDHGPTVDTSKSIDLAAGQYSIQMEWYENGGGAVAQLY